MFIYEKETKTVWHVVGVPYLTHEIRYPNNKRYSPCLFLYTCFFLSSQGL